MFLGLMKWIPSHLTGGQLTPKEPLQENMQVRHKVVLFCFVLECKLQLELKQLSDPLWSQMHDRILTSYTLKQKKKE